MLIVAGHLRVAETKRDNFVNEYGVVPSAPSQDVRAALAAVPVHDMASAEAWYTSLLGTEPDARPMDGLVEWRATASRGGRHRIRQRLGSGRQRRHDRPGLTSSGRTVTIRGACRRTGRSVSSRMAMRP